MEKSNNSTFCIIPFIQMATNVRGECRLCCESLVGIFKKNGEKYKLGVDKAQDIWHSSRYQEVRQKMLNGEKLPECRNCYDQESRGVTSKRLGDNNAYREYVDLVQKEKKFFTQPIFLDLRLGNKCNLKCRMCHPGSSSLMEKEVQHKWSRDSSYFSYYGENTHRANQSWYDSNQFKQDMEKLLSQLKRAYFAGGEPTINSEFYRFLNACIEGGHSKNIRLGFITNFFRVKDNLFDLFNHFKEVSLVLSIDAIGRRIEYIRHPLKWETMEKNISKLFPLKPNVTTSINCTVSVMNLFYLDELFDYIISLRKKHCEEIEVFLYPLYDPEHLKICILPLHMKHLAAQKVKNIFEKDLSTHDRKQLEGILNFLFSEPENPKQLSVFKEYTLELDHLRNENFSETFEELKELIEPNRRSGGRQQPLLT